MFTGELITFTGRVVEEEAVHNCVGSKMCEWYRRAKPHSDYFTSNVEHFEINYENAV